mmetsp:Transcript_17637/g.57064  ORF Transcript_17637/g.57064 Transcript_17637/m.57064 type:complete len:423 (-) Transcript_17637:345-1613(-)
MSGPVPSGAVDGFMDYPKAPDLAAGAEGFSGTRPTPGNSVCDLMCKMWTFNPSHPDANAHKAAAAAKEGYASRPGTPQGRAPPGGMVIPTMAKDAPGRVDRRSSDPNGPGTPPVFASFIHQAGAATGTAVAAPAPRPPSPHSPSTSSHRSGSTLADEPRHEEAASGPAAHQSTESPPPYICAVDFKKGMPSPGAAAAEQGPEVIAATPPIARGISAVFDEELEMASVFIGGAPTAYDDPFMSLNPLGWGSMSSLLPVEPLPEISAEVERTFSPDEGLAASLVPRAAWPEEEEEEEEDGEAPPKAGARRWGDSSDDDYVPGRDEGRRKRRRASADRSLVSSHRAGEEERKPPPRVRFTRKCAKCDATSTPQWRHGPDGLTVCNACGVANHKAKKAEKERLKKLAAEAAARGDPEPEECLALAA